MCILEMLQGIGVPQRDVNGVLSKLYKMGLQGKPIVLVLDNQNQPNPNSGSAESTPDQYVPLVSLCSKQKLMTALRTNIHSRISTLYKSNTLFSWLVKNYFISESPLE